MTPARNTPPNAATRLRRVAEIDIGLGLGMIFFGEGLVPLGDVIPGIRLWWLAGGIVVLGGVVLQVLSTRLGRRPPPPASDDPVQR